MNTKLDHKRVPHPLRETIWAVLTVFGFVFFVVATSNITGGISFLGTNINVPCYLQIAFRMPCPSCGLTRAMVAAAHLRLAEAWQQNWAGIWVIVGWIVLCIWRGRRALLLTKGKCKQFLAEKPVWGKIGLIYVVVFAALTVGNWLYKVMNHLAG